MSMLDSFFGKGFKGARCKTALKLTIPRIKLLRNRREVQLKQMRKEIAQLLQTGQEPTARIRVEHIIREQNIMAAYEIIELFCELVVVRLPIIETQRECPLDLREAIASLCFAAPRCSDLPELQQVQNMFAGKYGKEFVTAASELMPDCGVNRQIIEKLSVRAPTAEVKLKLMKEIAEEHEVEWDPSDTEAEFFKLHEDLLNGPNYFVSGSKLPLPDQKKESHFSSVKHPNKGAVSNTASDDLDLPEVPKQAVTQSSDTGVVAGTVPPTVLSPPPPQSALESALSRGDRDTGPHISSIGLDVPVVNVDSPVVSPTSSPHASDETHREKQFVPFISSPAPPRIPEKGMANTRSLSRTKSEGSVAFQDILAAAQAAAESADRAAAAARAAANLAKVRISEMSVKIGYVSSESDDDATSAVEDKRKNAFYSSKHTESDSSLPQGIQPDQNSASLRWQSDIFDLNIESGERRNEGQLDLDAHKSVFEARNSYEVNSIPPPPGHPDRDVTPGTKISGKQLYDSPTEVYSGLQESTIEHQSPHQPQRLTSMEDESYFSYPNLFNSQDTSSNHPGVHAMDNSTSFTKSTSDNY